MRLTGFAAFLFLTLSLISAQTSQIYFSIDSLAAEIVLNDFTISDTTFTQGQTVSFTITFENTGNAATTAQGHVYIYDAGNALVDSLDYPSTSISPNEEKTQITSWSNGGLLPGAYTARSNVTFIPYNASASVSNTLTVAFQITGGGGGGGGGSGRDIEPLQPVLPETPIELPEEFGPVIGPVEFTRFPVLKEIIAGQSSVQSIEMFNTLDKPQLVKMEIQGIDSDWISMTDDETQLLAGETRTMDIAVSVPPNAMSGDYLVRVTADAEDGKSVEFMVVRVRGVGGSKPTPLLLRTVEVDRRSGTTTVTLRLNNPTGNDIARIKVEDYMLQGLRADQVTFVDKQGTVIQLDGRRTLRWEIPELQRNDETRITYTVDGVLQEYSAYVNWQPSGLEISKRVDLSDVVSIVDFSATSMSADKNGQVVATVLYVGEEPLEVTMALEAPPGFTVNPNYLTATLQPRQTFTARFDVDPPEGTADTQLVRFLLYTDDGQVSARLPVVIAQPGEPASAGAVRISAGDMAMAGLAALALLIGYAVMKRRGDGGGAKMDPQRLEYARAVAKSIRVK